MAFLFIKSNEILFSTGRPKARVLVTLPLGQPNSQAMTLNVTMKNYIHVMRSRSPPFQHVIVSFTWFNFKNCWCFFGKSN